MKKIKTVSLVGACDLHIHSAPDIVERIGNDLEIAKQAEQAKMRAIVLKSVVEPTVSRAWHVMQQMETLKVFGGVVLDHHVGGLNPAAVEPVLKQNGVVVWLPTYHAKGHKDAFGAVGSFGYSGEEVKKYTLFPISILNEKGQLKEEVHIIMELCQESDAILATGHISCAETFVLAAAAREKKFKKLLVNHPFFKVPDMNVDMIGELIKMGAYIEFCANELCPIPRSANLNDYVSCFKRFGVSQIVLASDAGHNRKGWPAEELRIFAQLLGYAGAKEEAVYQMLTVNYEQLLPL